MLMYVRFFFFHNLFVNGNLERKGIFLFSLSQALSYLKNPGKLHKRQLIGIQLGGAVTLTLEKSF